MAHFNITSTNSCNTFLSFLSDITPSSTTATSWRPTWSRRTGRRRSPSSTSLISTGQDCDSRNKQQNIVMNTFTVFDHKVTSNLQPINATFRKIYFCHKVKGMKYFGIYHWKNEGIYRVKFKRQLKFRLKIQVQSFWNFVKVYFYSKFEDIKSDN